jgi:3'-5' exonuclease
MIKELNIQEVLFLDIETVPEFSEFGKLDDLKQKLWEEKSKFIREKKQISLGESYAEAGIYAEFGKIVCISVGYFTHDEKEFRLKSFRGDDENILLKEFAGLLTTFHLKPFRLLCAHNGKEFDFPYLCRRMLIQDIHLPELLNINGKKPWEVQHLDTMELWKFGDYKHYTSLSLLAHLFGIPTPKDDIKGSDVRAVYYEQQDLERIERYCRKDVYTVAMIIQAYRGVRDYATMTTAP